MTRREAVDVGGLPISYLTAGKGDGPLVLLLHGTYWSRVWQPVLEGIASAGLRPVAIDFPGFGRSGGELALMGSHQFCAILLQHQSMVGRAVDEIEAQIPLAGEDRGRA